MNDNNNYDKRMENLRRLGVSSSIIGVVEKCGRNSNIKFMRGDSPGSLVISFFGEFEDDDNPAVSIHKEHLAAVLDSIGNQFHHLDVMKHASTIIAVDTRFCKAIQSGLKNLKELEISYLGRWDASEVDALLKHMPSGLSKLRVYGRGLTFSPLAQKIPLLLPNLRALELLAATVDSQFLEEWAVLIGLLTSLEELLFKDICSKEEHWSPVLLALQAHPNLKKVKFEDMYNNDGGELKFDKEIEDSILCRLAINKANAQLKPEDTDSGHPTLEKWVNAVVDSRHQVGCLDYLLSSFDPTLYAPAAIKVLQGSGYKRKLERFFWSEKGLDERHQELKRQRQLAQKERDDVFSWPGEEENDSDSSDDGN